MSALALQAAQGISIPPEVRRIFLAEIVWYLLCMNCRDDIMSYKSIPVQLYLLKKSKHF